VVNCQPVWTVWSILLLAGLGGLVLAGLMLLVPAGSGARVFALLLLVAAAAATGVGAWGHQYRDAEHLVEIPAGLQPLPGGSSYLGLALAGAMFLALGLLVSSLVRSQMVAALVSLVLSLLFIVAGFWRPEIDAGSLVHQVVYFVSVPLHFARDFSRGLVDTRH